MGGYVRVNLWEIFAIPRILYTYQLLVCIRIPGDWCATVTDRIEKKEGKEEEALGKLNNLAKGWVWGSSSLVPFWPRKYPEMFLSPLFSVYVNSKTARKKEIKKKISPYFHQRLTDYVGLQPKFSASSPHPPPRLHPSVCLGMEKRQQSSLVRDMESRVQARKMGSIYFPIPAPFNKEEEITQSIRMELVSKHLHSPNDVYHKVCEFCKAPKKHYTSPCPGNPKDNGGKKRQHRRRKPIKAKTAPTPVLPSAALLTASPFPTLVPSASTAPTELPPPTAEPTNPGEEQPHSVFHSVTSYLQTVFKSFNMPKVYGNHLTEKDKGWLGRRNIVSNIFPFPDPSLILTKTDFKKFAFTPMPYWFMTAAMHVLDYDVFFWHMLPEGGLRCKCGECTGKLHRDGYLENFHVVHDFSLNFVILKLVGYRCSACNKFYTSISPEVILQLSPELRWRLDFLCEGPLLSLGALEQTTSAVMSGSSFEAVARMGADRLAGELTRRDLMRLEAARSHKTAFSDVKVEGCMLDFITYLGPGAPMLIKAFVMQVEKMEPKVQQSFLNRIPRSDGFSVSFCTLSMFKSNQYLDGHVSPRRKHGHEGGPGRRQRSLASYGRGHDGAVPGGQEHGAH